MIKRVTCTLLMLANAATATTYYVDPAGSNANDGLSPATPWRTLLKVGISSFQPGDSILFKRDGVWNEWLTPPIELESMAIEMPRVAGHPNREAFRGVLTL